MMESKNTIYVYAVDQFGVDSMQDFSSKTQVLDYILSDEFTEWAMISEKLTPQMREALVEASSLFTSSDVNFEEYSAKVLHFLTQGESEMIAFDILTFDDFCSGEGELSTEFVQTFCDSIDRERLESIPTELRDAFHEFLQNWWQ